VIDRDLTLDLPYTNRHGLWEPLLLMQAGHAQWQALALAAIYFDFSACSDIAIGFARQLGITVPENFSYP
jgi:hypothetical protein